MNLPKEFLKRMQEQLGDTYDAFIESYSKKAIKGIRVNTLKISVEDFIKICPFDIEPVPWTRDGFYVTTDYKLGKHPYYFAGLYYIQEPSAMLPAEILNPDSDDIVLDLCAAPGGKTMQMAAMMANKGLLISNDISSNRLRALLRNGELLGVKNLIVLNDHQSKIGPALYKKVDKLLIDAPCSGEGMFKKDDDAINAYADYDINECTRMQKEILDDILDVLSESGEMVYSTCTFNTFENEDMITYAKAQKALDILPLESQYGFKAGSIPGVLKLYPHFVKGEGHFVAKLKSRGRKEVTKRKRKVTHPPEVFEVFMKTYLDQSIEGHFKVIKDRLFLMPETYFEINAKTVKAGWYLGDLKKNRFEPSHAFALGLKSVDFKQVINFELGDPNVLKYLKCETLSCEGQKGYNLICVDHYPLGWGKWSNGKLKNLYPAAWRLQ